MKLRKESLLVPIIFGCILMLCFISVMMICKGNYDFLHIISEKMNFPPLWMFSTIYTLCLFFLGMSAGLFVRNIVECRLSLQNENLFLKGAIFCLISYFFSILWYPLLFCMQMPLIALIFLLFCILFVALALIFYFRVNVLYTLFSVPFVLWSVYLFVLNLVIVFRI